VPDKKAAKAEAKPDDEDDDEGDVTELGKRAQRRIDKLTWRAKEAERRQAKLEEEVAALKAGTKKEEPKADEKPAPVPDPVLQIEAAIHQLGPRPKLENFDTTEAWEEALAEHTEKKAALTAKLEVAKDRKEQQTTQAQEAANAEMVELFTKFQDNKAAAAERYEDFDEVLAANADVPVTVDMQIALMESPVGHDIAYYLATHRDEAEAIAAMNPRRAAIAMGKIEAICERAIEGLEAQAAAGEPVVEPPAPPAAKKAVPAKAVTKMDQPIKPLSGRSTTADVPLDQMSQEDYKARRNREEAERRRMGRR
jgi:hypothetical protein